MSESPIDATLTRPMKSAAPCALLVGLALVACQGPSPARPNVVVIFADDLGYGDLSCYGAPEIETPQLDRLAEEGLRFTDFYSAASVCTPARAALLTGRYPVRHLSHNLGPESTGGLPLEEVTLADVLRGAGYRTMAVGKWHLGHARPELLPTGRGFEHFVGLLYSNDMILPWCPWLSEEHVLELYRDEEAVELVQYDQEHLTELYTEEALRFIEDAGDEPFFLYLAHSMPHLPISVSERFRGRSRGGLYGDVIECLDWSTGEILRVLEERGLAEDTLVLFTSDNGPWHDLPERMLQRGVEPGHAGSADPLRGAKGSSWEGGFRVPAVLRWPAALPRGAVVHEPTSTLDLLPTVAAAAGVTLPEERVLDGEDLLPLLRQESASARSPFLYYRNDTLEALRDGRWKLRLAHDGRPELFALEADPGERLDRAGEEPELVRELYATMVASAEAQGGKVRSLDEGGTR